jgi:hypothetical protein
MKKVASEIIYLSLRQYFQDQSEDRIMELTIKLQRREVIINQRGDERGFLSHKTFSGSERARAQAVSSR